MKKLSWILLLSAFTFSAMISGEAQAAPHSKVVVVKHHKKHHAKHKKHHVKK